jgi:hypothetical protein
MNHPQRIKEIHADIIEDMRDAGLLVGASRSPPAGVAMRADVTRTLNAVFRSPEFMNAHDILNNFQFNFVVNPVPPPVAVAPAGPPPVADSDSKESEGVEDAHNIINFIEAVYEEDLALAIAASLAPL